MRELDSEEVSNVGGSAGIFLDSGGHFVAPKPELLELDLSGISGAAKPFSSHTIEGEAIALK